VSGAAGGDDRAREGAPGPALGDRPPLGISEIILVVSDVATTFAFYRDVVGLAVDQDASPDFKWLWAGPPGRSQRIGITSGPLSFGAAHCGGPQHFAFGVERARIPSLKARLEARGVAVEGPVEFRFWNAASIYFSDPAGNRVEFCGFGDPV
jgi:catechol 2,3-dioxygenase-like lactoylglutathione lyase family enzyme